MTGKRLVWPGCWLWPLCCALVTLCGSCSACGRCGLRIPTTQRKSSGSSLCDGSRIFNPLRTLLRSTTTRSVMRGSYVRLRVNLRTLTILLLFKYYYLLFIWVSWGYSVGVLTIFVFGDGPSLWDLTILIRHVPKGEPWLTFYYMIVTIFYDLFLYRIGQQLFSTTSSHPNMF